MGEGTPARIDRAALERIIQRAAELQTADRDIAEELTPSRYWRWGARSGFPGATCSGRCWRSGPALVPAAPSGALGAGGWPAAGDRPAHGAGRR